MARATHTDRSATTSAAASGHNILKVIGIAAVTLLLAAVPASAASPSCRITQAKSSVGKKASQITFVNDSGTTVNVYWLNYTGGRVFYRKLNPSQSYVQRTFITHPWVVVDDTGACYGYVLSDTPTKVFHIPAGKAKRLTFTAVVCTISVVAPNSSTCTAQVADAGPLRSDPPTGTATFSAKSGSVGQSCALAGTPGSPGIASCTVFYLPASDLIQGEPPPVSADYNGDAAFAPSSGSSSYVPASVVIAPAVTTSASGGFPASLVNPNPFAVSADVELTLAAGRASASAATRATSSAGSVIGRVTVSVKPLSSLRRTLKLNRTGRALLAKRGTLRATLKITTTAKGQPVKSVSRTVRITATR